MVDAPDCVEDAKTLFAREGKSWKSHARDIMIEKYDKEKALQQVKLSEVVSDKKDLSAKRDLAEKKWRLAKRDLDSEAKATVAAKIRLRISSQTYIGRRWMRTSRRWTRIMRN